MLQKRRDELERRQQMGGERTFLLPVELMLRGFALENLMKGVWVKRGNRMTRDGVLSAKGHDLVELATRLSVALTDEKVKVLKQLTMFSTVIGRYSIATRWDKGNGAYWAGHYYELLNEIREPLLTELNGEPEPLPKDGES